jgi:sulfonate transport system permease protein
MSAPTLRGIGGVLVFIACWQMVSTELVHFDYFPPPSDIAGAMLQMVIHPDVYEEIVHTLMAAILGWLISIALGLFFGIALGLSPRARTYCLASIEVLRPLPGIAFVPVAILIFGFSLQTELMVIVIPTIWPVLINTVGAFAAIPPRLRDVAQAFRLSSARAIISVFAPAAAPGILVGFRLSMALALIMAVAVEMIGNPTGLGYAVVREASALRPNFMFAYIVIIGILGVALNSLLVAGAKLVLPGEFNRPRAEWSHG